MVVAVFLILPWHAHLAAFCPRRSAKNLIASLNRFGHHGADLIRQFSAETSSNGFYQMNGGRCRLTRIADHSFIRNFGHIVFYRDAGTAKTGQVTERLIFELACCYE